MSYIHKRTLTCHYCISDERPVGGRYCLKSYILLFHVFHVFLLVDGLGGMFLSSLSLPSSFRSLTCCSSDMFFHGFAYRRGCTGKGVLYTTLLSCLCFHWVCVESSYCPLSGSCCCCLCLTSVLVGESWRNLFFFFSLGEWDRGVVMSGG